MKAGMIVPTIPPHLDTLAKAPTPRNAMKVANQ